MLIEIGDRRKEVGKLEKTIVKSFSNIINVLFEMGAVPKLMLTAQRLEFEEQIVKLVKKENFLITLRFL